MLTTLLCLVSAVSAPPPKETARPQYFPTEVGAKWESLLTGQPIGEDIHYSFSVSAVEEKDGETIVTLKRHDAQVPIISGTYKLTRDGVYSVGKKPRAFEPPLPVLKYPVKKDATWDWKGRYGDDERSETRTITSIEEVTVPAGTYKAAKVEILGYRASTGVQKWKSTEWFAEGVGRVKGVSNNLTDEMTKFTPAKK